MSKTGHIKNVREAMIMTAAEDPALISLYRSHIIDGAEIDPADQRQMHADIGDGYYLSPEDVRAAVDICKAALHKEKLQQNGDNVE